MDLNDLRIFQKVAEYGSVSRAAEAMSYVQSNVTARIKLLEKQLGTPLFHRQKRGMVLNAEGKRLLEYSHQILSAVEEMKAEFADRAAPSGILEIGIVETVAALPAILSSYYTKYPNVEISLQSGVTEQLIQDVLDMKLDGAFVSGPIKHPLIEQTDVLKEDLVLISNRDDFKLEEISSTPLLLYKKGCGYRERLENWLKMEGIIPRKIMEFGTFGTIIGSVSAGIGITVFPESAVDDYAAKAKLRVHPIPAPFREVTTVFIRRKDAYITRTLQSFIEEIATGVGKNKELPSP